MRNFFVMGHLLVMALMVISGTFVFMGLPFTDKLGGVLLWSVAYIAFERICKLVGVYK